MSGTFIVVASGFPAATLSETGALPGGVTFTDNGNGSANLSGTPASGSVGTYPLTITAHNGIGTDATQSFSLTVNQVAAITSANATTFTVGSAGTFTVTATGSPTPTLSESGALPAGVTFTASTGVLSGTPTASGAFPITFTAHNGAGTDATQSFTLTVNQGSAITSANAATFTVGSAGTFTLTATGFPVPTLSESGALPGGVTFNSSTGILSGTPTASGTFPITFTAHNGVGSDATQSFTLTVNQAATITSANTATFTVGSAGTFTVTATGAPTPTLAYSGTLPTGVTFNTGTGLLSGTPAAGTGGSYPITFTAHNGVVADATQNFTLSVNQVAAITSPTNTTIVAFIVGTPGSFPVTATGSPIPALSETGALPTGVTFVDHGDGTGTLGGTAALGTFGAYPVTITAHNGVGADATQSFTLTVTQAAAITSANSATLTVGTPGAFTLTATGSPTPTLSETGTLPGGVTFTSATGILAGTPAAGSGGSYPITFTAHNGVGTDATQSFTLTVDQPAAITSVSSATFTAGTAGTFTLMATGFPTPTLSETGTLPAGVTFTTATGILAGTPAAGTAGTYPITFIEHNGVGTDATQSFTLTVNQAAAITSANTSTFTIGSAGNFTVTATGLPVPSLSESGALPNGVTFTAATGILAGTPAAGTAGTYPITFTAHNGIGTDATQSFTLTVNQVAAITSANASTFTVGSVGTFTVTATGSPIPTLSETGTLPAGVTFTAATGILAGTLAAGAAGSYPITFTAHNGVGTDAMQSFTLTVNQSSTITSVNTATFTVGTAGTFTVAATGFPAPTLSETGTLPTGVVFTAATGIVSGTPAAGTAGSYPITFTAHNGIGTDATQSFTLTVNQVAAITSANTSTFTVGSAGTFTVTVSGSPTPTLSETGALPTGMTFTAATGTLAGTPASGAGGSYPITFTAHNGVGADATQNFTLTINQTAAITSTNTATFTVGAAGTFTLTATGSPAPTLSETGTLPTGVTFTSATGILAGTPAAGTAGSYPITFTAHNGIGADATQSFTLTVNQTAAITSANNTMFTVGAAGTFTLTATGSPTPTLSETGTLPTGVTFTAATGILAGTPAAGTAGSYPITFTAHNGVGADATQSFTLSVNQAAAITSASNTTFSVGTPGTFTLTAAGFPVPTLSETGTLPTGVTFTAATGILAGTPAAGTAGSYPITFTGHNGIGTDATQSFTLTVNQAAAITSINNTTFTVGTAGTFTLTATGSPTPTLSETGTLPTGVTFTAATGLLTGTPAAGTAGSYPITFTAHNGVGTDATQSFTLTVNQSAAITSVNSATFTVGTAGTFTLTATGFPTPALSETGALPAGVTFTAATGTLAGTPAAGTAGNYPITFTAHNGVGADATQSFTVTVNQVAAITSANTSTFTVGSAGTFTVIATGSPAPTLSETGTLPAGVTFTAATGILAGTPAAGTAGSYPVTFTAHNGVGTDATQSFTLTVNQAAAITSITNTTFTVGTAGTFTLTATGSPTPTLSETGTLPTGVTFTAATGILAGTPAAGTAGSYPITFTAHNGVGTDATQSFTLTINQVAAITSANTSIFTVGSAGTFTVIATGSPAPTLSETGALPTGVTFIAATGILAGTPAAGTAGSYPITFTAHNNVGTDATQSFTLTVNQVAAITSASNTSFTVGTAGTFTLTATGSPTPTLSETGTLPAGITFTAATGILTGTPAAGTGGSYPITFTAHNGVGTDATQSFTLTVNQSATITSANSATFTVGTAGIFTLTATGFPTATLSEAGPLPTGVTFTAATGILAGTPAAGTSGSFPITFTAHNGVGADATQSFTLTVNQAAAITSANTSAFTVGSAGTFTVIATGFPTPTLSEAGTLPSGVTFTAATGMLAGTPTAGTGGSYPITFTAHNGIGIDATQSFTLTVNQVAAITSANATTFTVGSAATFTVTATGSPTPTLSETGTLPTGVTFTAATGILAGTPAAGTGGSYPITFTAHNGVGSDATQSFTLTVNQVAAITSANATTFTSGSPGTFTVTATGSPTPTLSESGALPTGVTFNASTGVLAGTPTADGTFPVTFTAHNGVGTDAAQSFTLTVNQVAAINSANTASFTAGSAGTFTVTATGFPVPALSESGTLPSGVTFTDATGILAGTPAAGTGGSYPITFTAHNGVGTNATQSFTLTVNQVAAITSASTATFAVNSAGTFTVTATGFPVPLLSESGALPNGVTFNTSTGVLSGTATVTGTFPITFTAHNGVGTDATQSFTLTIDQAAAITSANATTFTTSSAGAFTVTATGFPAPSLSESGTLPSGVTFNTSTGILGGTPTVGGSYPITFTAHNGVGTDATQSFTLTVNQVASITSANTASFTFGSTGTFTVTATGFPVPSLSESGTLPNGVTFNSSTGALSGTATVTGTFPITFTAHNGIGTDAAQSFTLTVNQVAAITSTNNATFTIGSAGTFTVTATGFPVPSLSESGTLPNGVTFTAATGILAGTPGAGTGGSYPITFTAHNGAGADATQSFTLTVNQTAAITSANTASFTIGSAGTFTVTTTGSPTPTLSETGTLPSGVTFTAVTGILAGTPAAGTGGSYPITFTAHNGVGTDATQTFTLTVNQVAAITSANNASFAIGSTGNFNVTATGFPVPALSETGTLPTGVTFNTGPAVVHEANVSESFTVSSTPTTAGNAQVLLVQPDLIAGITAKNNLGQTMTLDACTGNGFANGAGDGYNCVFYICNGSAGVTSVTINGPQSNIQSAFFEISGVSPSGCAGAVSTVFGPTAPSVVSVTPSQPGGIGIAGFACSGSGTAISSSSIFTNVTDINGNPIGVTNFTGFSPISAQTDAGSNSCITSDCCRTNGYSAIFATFGSNGTGALSGTPTVSGSFPITFTATNGVGANATQSFQLTVDQVAGISSANNTTFTVGSPGTFTVTAAGFPVPVLSESGTLPSGVTFNAGTGVLSGTPTANGTFPITFTAHNGFGSDSTQNFTLTVNQVAAITSASATTFTVGSAGTFTVTAIGFPAPTLSESGTLPGGVTFNAATGALSGTPTASGTFPITFKAHNGVGTDATQSFALTVNQVAAITSANNATFMVSTAGTFIVIAIGSPTPTLSESGILPVGVTFNAATGILSGTPAAGAGGTYPILFTASNGVGANATQSFTLMVNQPLAITSANSATFTAGVTGSFSVTVTGSPVPTITETGALPTGVTFTDHGNGIATLAGLPSVATPQSYPFTITAHNGISSDATQSFTLTIIVAPSITTQPVGQTVNAGQTATFMVAATGSTPLFYQWQENGANITNATSSSYTTSVTAMSDNGEVFSVVVTNIAGSTPSMGATLTVNTAPTITSPPASQVVTAGQTATFMVAATGPGTLTYQWQKNSANIMNATSSSYTTAVTTVADDGSQFDVIVTNFVGSTTSSTATLNVNPPVAPTITMQPTGQSIVTGEAATFTVAATGSPNPTYQWQKNNVNIPGATSPYYTTPIAALTDNNSQFDVIVTNEVQSVTSNVVAMTVTAATSPAIYYIDPTLGLDTNSGVSKNAPWQNAPGMATCAFNCALVTLNPGDRVIFKGGETWNSSYFPMLLRSSGTAGSPIYFGVNQTWFTGISWTRPVFDLANITWEFGPVYALNANYLTIDNLEIRNEEVDGTVAMPRGSINVDGGSNVTIQNSYIHGWSIASPAVGSDGSPSGGIAFFDGSTGGVVKNSVLDGFPESNSGTGIYGGSIIQGNVIENVPNGIFVSDPAVVVSGNSIFNIPYSVDPSESSNALQVLGGGSIYNNIIHDLAEGASAVTLESESSLTANTQYFYNNLIWNVGDTAPILINSAGMSSSATSNQYIYNNTLSAGAVPCMSVSPNEIFPTNLIVQNNHCISNEPTPQVWCWNGAAGNFDCGQVTNLTFTNNVVMTTAIATSEGYTTSNGFQPSSPSAGTVGAGISLSASCPPGGTPPIGTSLCSDLLGVLRPTGTSPWDAGAYSYQATGSVTPLITSQPFGLAVLEGQTATFSVTAIGSPAPTYQWKLNGTPIQGATSPVYTTPATVAATDNGSVFTVVVSSAAGSVTSSPAQLAVDSTAGQIVAITPSLNFGNVNMGSQVSLQTVLYNSSGSNVTISNLTISGAGYSISGVPSGMILTPQQYVGLTVTFTPTSAVSVPGSVTITSDAANSPTVIPLTGTGVQPAHWVDLSWDLSTSAVFGYNVYRATDLYGPYTVLNSTPLTVNQYTDYSVVPGQTYIYWVTSVDANTAESPLSAPVPATIPTP